MKQSIFLLSLLAILCGCGNNDTKTPQTTRLDRSSKPAPIAVDASNAVSREDSITAIGTQILTHLKYKDYPQLVKYFSSEGILFSPYGYIDTATSKKLTAEDFLTSINKNWILTWGSFDGTGDPIKLSIKDYLKKFVYNADYMNAEAVGVDKAIQEGNSRNNIRTIYPNHHFVDYYFSGFKQENKGMDWTSLKLVFRKTGGEYFLVAVVHDQWTI